MAQKTTGTAKPRVPGDMAAEPVRRYPTHQLLASKALSGYQPDFARAVFTKPEYTVGEALAALDDFFKGGGAYWLVEPGPRRIRSVRAYT